MDKEILTVADASELLALPEDEVRRLLTEGDLPGRRVGPHWYISRQRLLQFIANVDHPESPSKAPATLCAKSLPPKVLGPNWRCPKCEEVLSMELAECPHCGAIRNTPLMGFRLPTPPLNSGTSPGRKIN